MLHPSHLLSGPGRSRHPPFSSRSWTWEARRGVRGQLRGDAGRLAQAAVPRIGRWCSRCQRPRVGPAPGAGAWEGAGGTGAGTGTGADGGRGGRVVAPHGGGRGRGEGGPPPIPARRERRRGGERRRGRERRPEPVLRQPPGGLAARVPPGPVGTGPGPADWIAPPLQARGGVGQRRWR